MFKMGCAKADVTPSWKTYIRGYASRNRLTDEVEEPIEVGIVALEQDGVKSLIVTCDLIGIEFSDSKKIYAAIKERTGEERDDGELCSARHEGGEHSGRSALTLVTNSTASHNAGDSASRADNEGNDRLTRKTNLLKDRIKHDGRTSHIAAILKKRD